VVFDTDQGSEYTAHAFGAACERLGIALLLLLFAFFSCGTSIQGAGSRLMFSYARDRALSASAWVSSVHKTFKTPINALLSGAVVTALFVLLEFASPAHDMKILWFKGNVNVLVSLVSFGCRASTYRSC
jgi:amino acid transporter